MPKYEARPIEAKTVEVLRKIVEEELRNVGQATVDDFLELTITYVEPTKRFAGLVVYADGTLWDPGAGEGIYRWSLGAAWVKVG